MPDFTPPKLSDTPFVNEVRLSARQWLAAVAIVLLVVTLTPALWKKVERFETGPDYRMPYALSRDYWLYQRRLEQLGPSNIVVLGDSVVWGEYVLPDGTLTHYLNDELRTDRFINAGVNGLFPLALEGLARSYGKPLQRRKIILHANVLWMTSPKADLSSAKEEQFNHATLVPQYAPKIPAYRADTNERINGLVERRVPFLSWVNHLQVTSFGQKSIPKWTLEEEGSDPPRYPNAGRNPLAQISLRVPSPPADDPERGPRSPRHKAWSTNAMGSTQFEWVGLDRSLQWGAFQRLVGILRRRGNDVFVVLGPFNEHIMADENRPAYRKIRGDVIAWLNQNQVPHADPETLPSLLYADASHPLTEGYQLLAKRLATDPAFRNWAETK